MGCVCGGGGGSHARGGRRLAARGAEAAACVRSSLDRCYNARCYNHTPLPRSLQDPSQAEQLHGGHHHHHDLVPAHLAAELAMQLQQSAAQHDPQGLGLWGDQQRPGG